MRKALDERMEAARIAGDPGAGPYGSFRIRCPETNAELVIIASDGRDWAECGMPGCAWEHISVSTKNRCPTWGEMAWAKRQFWAADECAIEYHPPERGYVRIHPFVLHIWRPLGHGIPMPPERCV